VGLGQRRKDPKVRYYVYVSDTKLDMLFEQIDRSVLKRISAEIKVDLKLASVTLRQADNPAPARAAKLRVVERFIDRHHHVGDIENPGTEYFRGRLKMTWGWLRWRADVDENGIPRRDMVLFQGHQGHHTVGLAGAGRHVLAWNGIGEPMGMALTSASLDIIWALDQHISNDPELVDLLRERAIRNPHERGRPGGQVGQTLNLGFFNGPPQLMEFLAVPLAQDERRVERFPANWFDSYYADNTILATPLYVALASGPGGTATPTGSTRTDQVQAE